MSAPTVVAVTNPITGQQEPSPSAVGSGLLASGIPAVAGVIWNGVTYDRYTLAGDGFGAGGIQATTPMLFDGSVTNRQRGNQDTAALITAAGATLTQTGADQTNYNGRGVKIVLDMTNVGTGSVTITIQGKDAASGKYYTLLAGLAITTISTNVYEVYPGSTAAANAVASAVLPRTWRVLVTAGNANPTTYTVGASVIV